MKKLLKYFVYGTLGITFLGVIFLLNDGELDIYAVWNFLALAGSVYLIENK